MYGIVLNAHAPTENKYDDTKQSFYEELESIFDQFRKYQMEILLGDCSAKVGKEGIFTPTVWNKCRLNEVSNDNAVRVVYVATSKNRIFKSALFPHCKLRKYTWTSCDGRVS